MLDQLIRFLEINIELVKIEVKNTVSQLLAEFVKLVVGLFFLAMLLVFGSIALALYLGELLSNQPVGFLLISVLYVLLFGSFLAYQRKIKQTIKESIDEEIPDNTDLLKEADQSHEKNEL
jgi:hypothetical protein